MADTLQHDLRAAWRSLRRSPRFTFLALAMLVVGIGATTAIFSLVRGVLLRPLPYDDPGRLVVVWADLVKQGNHRFSVTPDDFADIRKDTVHFSAVAAQLGWGANFTGDGPPEAIRGAQVSSQFFAVAGIVPRLGRAITAEDSAETGGQVVVLADGLWRRRFGGDPSVIGRAIRIDDRPYTVIGVMPREFRAPSFFKAPSLQAEFWVPLALPAAWNNREAAVLQILARLAPGVTGAEARNAMSALATRLQAAYPATNTDVGFNVVPLHEQLVGSTRTVLLVLLGGVGLLLLIACANVASLLLARGIARRRDVAVRVALGAGRQRLVRTFLAESLLLAGTGGLLGLGLAAGGLHALVSLLPADMPRLDQIRLDPAVFGFTFGVSALVGVIFGVVPAIRATRLNPAGALVAGGARGVV
ncbi:MAG: ABC transporter permease, partial [Gemmatimonadales bacterium]